MLIQWSFMASFDTLNYVCWCYSGEWRSERSNWTSRNHGKHGQNSYYAAPLWPSFTWSTILGGSCWTQPQWCSRLNSSLCPYPGCDRPKGWEGPARGKRHQGKLLTLLSWQRLETSYVLQTWNEVARFKSCLIFYRELGERLDLSALQGLKVKLDQLGLLVFLDLKELKAPRFDEHVKLWEYKILIAVIIIR